MKAPTANTQDSAGYAKKRCYPELVFVLVAGLLHVLMELSFSDTTAHLYNAAVSVGVATYLVWRVKRSDGVLRAWGMRRGNLLPSLRAQAGFGIIGVIALVSFGGVSGTLVLPETFWMTLAFYPIWGIARQFALQNFFARNLNGVFSNRFVI